MKMTEIEEYIDDNDLDLEYGYIGIRVQDEEEKMGETISHKSHVWDDGDDTGKELNGVSALLVGHTDTLSQYVGQHVYLIGSDEVEFGEDAGEVVMTDPVVLAEIEK